MKNIGSKLISSVCALALVANSVTCVMAQDRKQGRKGEVKNITDLTRVTIADNIAITSRRFPGGAPLASGASNSGSVNNAQQSGDSAFQFFSHEKSFDNRLVTGAPFSADVVSETIQILQDGTRIVQRFDGRIYRDSQGRTRNERIYHMDGTGEQKQIINIYDPVGGASYRLNSETKTARKSSYPGLVALAPPQTLTLVARRPSPNAKNSMKVYVSEVKPGKAMKRIQPSYPPIAKAANASGPVKVQVLISETGEVIDAHAVSGHPLLQDAAVQAARGWVFEPTEIAGRGVRVKGILTFNFALVDEGQPPAQAASSVTKSTANTEQLGKKMVEGVECEGERAVTTMPVGTIGNDRPIETINETWYSPELKIMILSKRSDPRFGESTYSVTNITRSEPDAALFQAPSEYTLIDGESKKQVTLDMEELESLRRRIRELQRKIERSRRPDEQ
ncbi:MAG TPA: energy transducer TonB [Blastocatellia bacterium]|nr:energy transducer TonB [Blastocatellia bacterium]